MKPNRRVQRFRAFLRALCIALYCNEWFFFALMLDCVALVVGGGERMKSNSPSDMERLRPCGDVDQYIAPTRIAARLIQKGFYHERN